MKITDSKRVILVFLFVSFLLISSCNSGSSSFSCGIGENSQRGMDYLQPLVYAMEKYKSDNGRYPKYFDNLTPNYISEIPILSLTLTETAGWKIIKDKKLGNSMSDISDDGSYFNIRFYPTDDRVCLTGKNNICEYTSQTKQWNCYIH